MSSVNKPTAETSLLAAPGQLDESAQKKKKVMLFGGFLFFVFVGLIICVILALVYDGSTDPNLYLQDIVSDTTVKCCDGSAPKYYTRTEGGDTNNWIIFLEYGGSFCWDQETCDDRLLVSPGDMGSGDYEDTKELDGLLSADPDQNPYMYDWNVISIPYCSSDSFSGTADAYVDEENIGSNTTYYFHGHRIWSAVIADVLENGLLDDAEKILIAGQGSGGYGVLTQIDLMVDSLAALGDDVEYYGFMDTAWTSLTDHYLDPYECDGPGTCPLDVALQPAMDTWQPMLPERCTEYDLTWECYLAGESNVGLIRTPVFAFEYQYEIAVLTSEGVTEVDEENFDWAYDIAQLRKEELEELNDQSGYLYVQCYDHEITTKDYASVRGVIDEYAITDALNDFVNGDGAVRLADDCGDTLDDINCNPTCGATL